MVNFVNGLQLEVYSRIEKFTKIIMIIFVNRLRRGRKKKEIKRKKEKEKEKGKKKK
jgi:hypothetical protein